MTKEAALFTFWSRFGVPAYDEQSVPTGSIAPNFPYITYQVSTDSFGNEISLTGSVWYKSTSWKDANKKAQEISDYIGMGGVMILCDGGAIWIKRGTPFAQSMGDPSDDMIKRKYINLTAEFLSAN